MRFLLITLVLISISAIGSLIRILIGPTIWDRMLGLGLTASKVTLGVIIVAFMTDESYILDIAMLFSMLGFLVTVLLAKFVETRGGF